MVFSPNGAVENNEYSAWNVSVQLRANKSIGRFARKSKKFVVGNRY